MFIYFDSKDLIDILEKSLPLSAGQLKMLLCQSGHKLVFSVTTIMEISEPLLHRNAKTNVMSLLRRLEKIPHTFIHSSSIPRLELAEAYRAFSEGEECASINPFVNRFDYTVDLNAKPATDIYLNYSLCEIVWDLYCCGELGGLDDYAGKMKQLLAADRELSPKPSLRANFAKTIGLNLSLHKVPVPSVDVAPFAKWIYSNPSRCPGERLGYEVWHKIVKNFTDKLDDSDMDDFQHIGCLPYVELMTLDRRMCGYVFQAGASLNQGYDKKVFKSPEELIMWL